MGWQPDFSQILLLKIALPPLPLRHVSSKKHTQFKSSGTKGIF